MQCAVCGETEDVRLEPSRTCYTPPEPTRYERLCFEDPLNDDPPDPNADIPLCRGCAADHHAYWDEMWKDYYSSRL